MPCFLALQGMIAYLSSPMFCNGAKSRAILALLLALAGREPLALAPALALALQELLQGKLQAEQ